VFLRIHSSLAGVRNGDRLDAWLYRIARNAIADHHRSPARRREVPAGAVADMDALPSAQREEEVSELAGAAACLRPMVDCLPRHWS
jgi:RNA polymerase sigma-70 factor, ECF subfamily